MNEFQPQQPPMYQAAKHDEDPRVSLMKEFVDVTQAAAQAESDYVSLQNRADEMRSLVNGMHEKAEKLRQALLGVVTPDGGQKVAKGSEIEGWR